MVFDDMNIRLEEQQEEVLADLLASSLFFSRGFKTQSYIPKTHYLPIGSEEIDIGQEELWLAFQKLDEFIHCIQK
jgi:hypothetical protein